MQVFFRPEKLTPPSTAIHIFGNVSLAPGLNDLNDSAYAQLMAHPCTVDYLSAGAISPKDSIAPALAEESDALVNVNTVTAKELDALPPTSKQARRSR